MVKDNLGHLPGCLGDPETAIFICPHQHIPAPGIKTCHAVRPGRAPGYRIELCIVVYLELH